MMIMRGEWENILKEVAYFPTEENERIVCGSAKN
jgi:hypothetical protein